LALLVFGFQFSGYTPVLYHAYISAGAAVVSLIGLATVLARLGSGPTKQTTLETLSDPKTQRNNAHTLEIDSMFQFR
jgi:hypothetical protein